MSKTSKTEKKTSRQRIVNRDRKKALDFLVRHGGNKTWENALSGLSYKELKEVKKIKSELDDIKLDKEKRMSHMLSIYELGVESEKEDKVKLVEVL